MLSTGIVFGTILALAFASRSTWDGRIVGGHDVDIKDYPYQVSLRFNGYHICGGSIISRNCILTAAHCVYRISPNNIAFRAGSTNKLIEGTVHKSEQIIVHPEYYGGSSDYDYAVVKVSQPFPIGQPGYSAAKLATKEPTEGVMTVSGWGQTQNSSNSMPLHLQAADVELVNRAECNAAYGDITPRMICARGLNKDACQGDSGGPLFNKMSNELVGVVSWGRGCANPSYPGIYANIADQLDWIARTCGV